MKTNLREYQRKRDFKKTAEPKGSPSPKDSTLYLIQKHAASRLHYDFRLALDGVLKSWAVPKGPSTNPNDKRLAVHVEDHPLEYGSFEGTIPKGEYGGGTVMLWDTGSWKPIGDPHAGYAKGHLVFELQGKRLHGTWALIRMHGAASEEGKNWLLVKEKDGYASTRDGIVEKYQESVTTGRSMNEIADHVSKRAAQPKKPASAKKSVFPTSFKPQLATLVEQAPIGRDWIHEIKFDGYRLLAFIEDGKVRLVTRNGQVWTNYFRRIADEIQKLALDNTILDGEVVVQREDGTTDFQALQNALKNSTDKRLVYYVFDMPFWDGMDLGRTPLIERKQKLKEVLASASLENVRLSEHIEGSGGDVFKNACHYALEGIISKKIDSPYVQRRSRDWVKVKCVHEQEFVIGGFTEPKKSRQFFGSLLLGTYNEKGELVYNGHVGTGFTDTSLKSVFRELEARVEKSSPFHEKIQDKLGRHVSWVKPELVCEVIFSGWTSDNVLRHPVFKGLREDKKAKEVGVERALPQAQPDPARAEPSKGTVAGVKLTHPDKILYSEQGLTKRDICEYYERVAPWMIPHLKGRPMSLVRCPNGEGKACFFQKHFTESSPKAVREIDIKEKDKTAPYILIDDAKGLVSLVQLGVLEFHPWPATEKNIEKPDRLIFDLDPAPDVPFKELISIAKLVRDRLADEGLMSFVKTTGGKGLHVVVPVTPVQEWNAFKEYAAKIANDIVKQEPNRVLATMSKAKRAGKIFLDYFRNGRGATSVCAYSTRARVGAPISMPIAWDELTTDLKPLNFSLTSVIERLEHQGDAWRGFFQTRQTLPE